MLQSRKDDYIQRLIKRFFEALGGLVDKRTKVPDEEEMPGLTQDIAQLYPEFFEIERAALIQQPIDRLDELTASLDADLVRPLALLLYQDALASSQADTQLALLGRAKTLFDLSYQKTGQLLLEDLSILADIDARIAVG